MLFRAAAFTVALVLVNPIIAAAADDTQSGSQTLTAAQISRLMQDHSEHRPLALKVLYGSYGVLQAADVIETQWAMRTRGAREVNPLMGSGDLGQMIALKAAGSAISVYCADRLWKHNNRTGSIVTMAVVNSLTAAVIAHNLHDIKR